jgi:rhodanese-related sulfurtransferase
MVKNITLDELKNALDAGEVDYLIDARSPEEFAKAHIEGAMNVPAAEAEKGKGLPQEKDARIVFYCNDPQ